MEYTFASVQKRTIWWLVVILFRNNLSFLAVVVYYETEQVRPFAPSGFPGFITTTIWSAAGISVIPLLPASHLFRRFTGRFRLLLFRTWAQLNVLLPLPRMSCSQQSGCFCIALFYSERFPDTTVTVRFWHLLALTRLISVFQSIQLMLTSPEQLMVALLPYRSPQAEFPPLAA